MTKLSDRAAAVIIGRNERRTLLNSLKAVRVQFDRLIYVDSGSNDGSVEAARAAGVAVKELSPDRPFTAARARNAGLRHLLASKPAPSFIQFVDADTELGRGWAAEAVAFLTAHGRVAGVCGRLRERFPDDSVYNRLCEIEWDTPVGETLACGGNAMWRSAALLQAGGFREDLIAGEEPELCYRLRRNGWTIHKLATDMATHDAAMTTARQWWARNKRSGYAVAQALAMRGKDEPWLKKQVFSNVFWSIPAFWPLWPLLWTRMYRLHGAAYATHIVVGKIPHLQGQLYYWADALLGRTRRLIEHK